MSTIATHYVPSLDSAEYKKPYVYQPLDLIKREIRLLRLLPEASTDCETTIYCDLFITSLDDDPKYEALSYVWGTSSTRYKIHVGNGALRVTPNLFEALFNLRTKTSQFLWIDAICIDQKNVSERNYQVSVMRQIFSGAELVRVWLGNLSLPSVRLDGTPFLSSLQQSHLTGSWVDGSNERERIRTSLQALLRHPWFTRIWVVQELVLAKDAWVHVGQDVISWESLTFAVRNTGLKFKEDNHFNSLATQRRAAPHQRTLLEMVLLFQTWESTDPLDKIYGLVGLTQYSSSATEDPQRLEHPHTTMTIDYRLNEHAAIINLVKYHLAAMQNLDFLSCAGHNSADMSLVSPSWAPLNMAQLQKLPTGPSQPFMSNQKDLVRVEGDALHVRGCILTSSEIPKSDVFFNKKLSTIHAALLDGYSFPVLLLQARADEHFLLLVPCSAEMFWLFSVGELERRLRRRRDEDSFCLFDHSLVAGIVLPILLMFEETAIGDLILAHQHKFHEIVIM
jgi:hypothetical protein